MRRLQTNIQGQAYLSIQRSKGQNFKYKDSYPNIPGINGINIFYFIPNKYIFEIKSSMPKFSSTNNPYYTNNNNDVSRNQQDEVMSNRSGSSCHSARQIIFQRSNMSLVESRISAKSINKSRVRKDSRQLQRSSLPNNYLRQSKIRSLSASRREDNLSNSKTRLLNQIAEKLKNKQKIIYDSAYQNNRHKTHYQPQVPRLRVKEQSGRKSQNSENKTMKSKLSKLQNLLSEIKKSNREAVLIKKHKQQPINTIMEESTPKNQYLPAHRTSNLPEIHTLAEQLRIVKQELHQVKRKNDQLMSISQSRANDLNSQSSKLNVSYQEQQPNITNQRHHQEWNTKRNYILMNNDLMQPCFACGCTCKSKNNIHKY